MSSQIGKINQSIASPNPVSLRQATTVKLLSTTVSGVDSKSDLRIEVVNAARKSSVDNSQFSVSLQGNQLSISLEAVRMTAGVNTILIRNIVTGETATARVVAFD